MKFLIPFFLCALSIHAQPLLTAPGLAMFKSKPAAATALNIQFIQSNTSSGSSVAFTGNTTAGDTILAFFGDLAGVGGVAPTSFSDTQGNTFTVITNYTGSLDTYHGIVSVYIAIGIVGGADTVTPAGDTMSAFGGLQIREYSGVHSVANMNSGSAASVSDSANISLPITTTSPAVFLGFTVNHSGSSFTATLDATAYGNLVNNSPTGNNLNSLDWLASGTGFTAGTHTASTTAMFSDGIAGTVISLK